jgi:hypothetical protein
LIKHNFNWINLKKSWLPPLLTIVVFSLNIMLFSATSMTTLTYAAIATKKTTTTTTTNTPTVKIISPLKGQQVINGRDLLVSGISSFKDHNGDCTVSIIVNGLKPYQRAVAIGHSGTNDYSAWKYTITPKYASVKQGQNKITAKISCLSSPANLTKFYSVNVTGVARVIHGANGLNGKNGTNGSAISGSNGGIAIGGIGGRGGNGGSAVGGNGGSAVGGNGGNGGNGGSAIAKAGNGGIAIGGIGGRGGNGGNTNGGNNGG